MLWNNVILILAYVSLVAGLIFLFRYVVGVARCIEAQHKALLHMRTELRTVIDGLSVLELRLDDITHLSRDTAHRSSSQVSADGIQWKLKPPK